MENGLEGVILETVVCESVGFQTKFKWPLSTNSMGLLNIALIFSYTLFRSIAESKHILKVNVFFNILLYFLIRRKKSYTRLTLRYIPWTAVLIILTQSFSVYTVQNNVVKLLQEKNSNNHILCFMFFIHCHIKNMKCF